jgi:predicted nucleic acid-binding Zn ribbon protein
MKTCNWCGNNFTPNVNYQIYCSPECREFSTKEKVNERQRSKKRQSFMGKKRYCSAGCGTILSIYNSKKRCNQCNIDINKIDKALKQLKGIIDYERIDD